MRYFALSHARRSHASRGPLRSVPPRGSWWVLLEITYAAVKEMDRSTHPLPRGGTDLMGRDSRD